MFYNQSRMAANAYMSAMSKSTTKTIEKRKNCLHVPQLLSTFLCFRLADIKNQ